MKSDIGTPTNKQAAPNNDKSSFQYSLAPKDLPAAKTKPVAPGRNTTRTNGALIYFGAIILIVLLGTAGAYFYLRQSAIKADSVVNNNANTSEYYYDN